jgi:hypothetical protein
MRTRLVSKHTHTSFKGRKMADFTHQARRDAFNTDSVQMHTRIFQLSTTVLSSYGPQQTTVYVHILRRGSKGSIMDHIMLIDFLRPHVFLNPIYLLLIILHSFTIPCIIPETASSRPIPPTLLPFRPILQPMSTLLLPLHLDIQHDFIGARNGI